MQKQPGCKSMIFVPKIWQAQGRTDTAENRTNAGRCGWTRPARSCNFSNWHFSAMIAVEHAAIKANRIMLLANATTAARSQQKLTNNYGRANLWWVWVVLAVWGCGVSMALVLSRYVQRHVNAQQSGERLWDVDGNGKAASGKKLLGKGKSQKGFVYAKKFYKPLTKMLRLGICHIKFTQQQQKQQWQQWRSHETKSENQEGQERC